MDLSKLEFIRLFYLEDNPEIHRMSIRSAIGYLGRYEDFNDRYDKWVESAVGASAKEGKLQSIGNGDYPLEIRFDRLRESDNIRECLDSQNGYFRGFSPLWWGL